MLKYIGRRILMMIPILLAVTFVVFTLLYITPGNPAELMLGQNATPEAVAELEEELGLNRPFLVRYADYLMGLLRLDMGTSYATKEAVMTRIWNCVPYTLELAAISIFIAAVIGTPIGIISATKQYTAFDNVTMIFALIGISMPVFWIGILLILLFSVHLKWLPPSGWGTMKQMILPAITVAAQSVAVICRMTRSSMLEVMRQDYVTTARAKGVSKKDVTFRHQLRNSMIPIVTTMGMRLGSMVGSTVLIESLFVIPGLGSVMMNGISNRDFMLVANGVLIISIFVAICNLVVDILYGIIDPRTR